jgi:hypothetical protein
MWAWWGLDCRLARDLLSRKPEYATTLNDSMAAGNAGIERDNDPFGGYDLHGAEGIGSSDDNFLLAISSRAVSAHPGYFCHDWILFCEMSAKAEERIGSVDRWSKTGCIL